MKLWLCWSWENKNPSLRSGTLFLADAWNKNPSLRSGTLFLADAWNKNLFENLSFSLMLEIRTCLRQNLVSRFARKEKLKPKVNISSVRQAQAFGSEPQARRDDAEPVEASSSAGTLSVPISPAQRGGAFTR
ncbi:MAG: hypothetical protein COT34_01770 [Candidatus Nealsonbacteria bacterium CG08_land_8_20_14_0_20_43_11]|uniref:Uncharacterized protein n=1 Tax=Candidatus Nealsonbacteria bacterium CG08_land_8_20_14_0_20_43_11 TaxID=1974706 RepID=A0A2M6T0F4_9BACT|nr:MAG: hypothetical protein COT34_01770 [Candidatus Nealsonbacteria bacterium CG08_land_8_20_14_0_20_43_11]